METPPAANEQRRGRRRCRGSRLLRGLVRRRHQHGWIGRSIRGWRSVRSSQVDRDSAELRTTSRRNGWSTSTARRRTVRPRARMEDSASTSRSSTSTGTSRASIVRSAVYREYVTPRANGRGMEDRERALALDVSKTTARSAAEEALLDAAERLLVDVGYAGITTRRLAEEAGVNHGLVHYYFGSNENLLVRALERFTERLIERQRELYAADMPFIEKWRTAMRYLVSEDVTYEKVWLELQALAWNNAGPARAPRARERRVARGADRGLRGAASRARHRDAARRARLARDDVQYRDHRRAPRAASRPGTTSCSSGSTSKWLSS